jgi:hypothetical protein
VIREHPRAALAAAAFWLLGIFMGVSFIRSAAATYDEPVHLASGYSYWHSGPYRLNISDHPPLAEMWAAVPLLAMRPVLNRAHPDWIRMRRYPFADDFLYRNRIPPGTMLNAARLFCLLTVFGAVGFVLFAWGMRIGGPAAAVGAVAAGALSPVLVSNAAIVATDGLAAAAYFAAFYMLSERPLTRVRFAAAGAAVGVALASKFSMVLLPAFAAGLLLLDHGFLARPDAREEGGERADKKKGKRRRERERSLPGFDWGGALLASAVAAFVVALAYKFGQLPLFFDGLKSTIFRLGGDRASYLLGKHSVTGFPLYFPIALLVKTPLAVLLAGLGAALVWGRKPERTTVWAVLPALAYFATALTSKLQIGVRHLLPMLPFLALWAGCAAGWLWEARGRFRAAAVALAVWAALSVGIAHPYYLAYFNEIAGGVSGGHRWLADSNLDWGQDVEGLAEYLRERGNPPIYLSYFGVADPSAYGLRYVPVVRNWNVPRDGHRVDPAASGKVLYAISATMRQTVYRPDKRMFDWLKSRKPVAEIGGSVFLYDLTADPEGRRELARLVLKYESPEAAGLAKSLLLQ